MRVLLNLEGILDIVEAKEIYETVIIEKSLAKKTYHPAIGIIVDYETDKICAKIYDVKITDEETPKEIIKQAFIDNYLDLSNYIAAISKK